ncbi:hypothetical protein D3C83_00510 [compost metagenome]
MRRLWIVIVLVAGCASPGGLFGETVGEKFRKALANVDAFCKKNKIGPYLDRNDYESRRNAGATDCEVLKIKPFDLNAVLATPEGKYAYSIRLPAPLDRPRVKRADYGTAEEYFEALCEKETGDSVFRSIGQAKGVAILRTPPPIYRYRLGSFSEETIVSTGGGPQPELLLIQKMGFEYVERHTRPDERHQSQLLALRRYTLDPDKPIVFPDYALRFESIPSFSAPFGVLWRGTPQFDSREEGIIGGELIVVDRASDEVLAVRRLFTRDEVDLERTDRVRYRSRSCPGKVITDGYDLIGRALSAVITKGR